MKVKKKGKITIGMQIEESQGKKGSSLRLADVAGCIVSHNE